MSNTEVGNTNYILTAQVCGQRDEIFALQLCFLKWLQCTEVLSHLTRGWRGWYPVAGHLARSETQCSGKLKCLEENNPLIVRELLEVLQ